MKHAVPSRSTLDAFSNSASVQRKADQGKITVSYS